MANKHTVLTGDRPTGPLHLGHYVGSLLSRVALQDTHNQYIMIADIQALTDNFETPQKVRDNVFEVAKDYLAIGIDPSKSTIFIQSLIPALAELTVFYLNLVTVSRLERNPTVKAEIQQKGFDTSLPAGFLCYPVSQAADITAFQAKVVPVGEDQLPMLEQTNEIVRRFNRIYSCEVLKEVEIWPGKVGRLVGIDGQLKASKSAGNAIYLSDGEEEVKRKVMAMFTDPTHLKVSDPGKVDGNVVFAYLDAFHHDKEEVAALKAHYQRGGLGDMTIKKLLLETLEALLAPIRQRRASISEKQVREILLEGTQLANKTANHTLQMVREAIGVEYF
ncbi:MAG: tryptophan--tRNA ligase [Proteobacteria bacterium]|nr:tryptophan--tRNA ligase [Pseudomonadota bacterium]